MDPCYTASDLQHIFSIRARATRVVNPNMVEQPEDGKNNDHEFLFFRILGHHT